MKRFRLLILALSTPLVLVVVLGGLYGSTAAGQGAFPHLRVFEDVISLILSSYVEEVQVDEVMEGALRGLADGLDGDSAYLTAAEAKLVASNAAAEPGEVGVVLSRQYYLRVIAAREHSPAHKAGIRSGDYIRGIDGQPTREMSIIEGARRLRGAPGTSVKVTVIRGNTADPREFTLVREAAPTSVVTSRKLAQGPGYIRVTSFGGDAPAALKAAALRLQSEGVPSIIIDVRNTAEGPIAAGVDAARAFVATGALAIRGTRGDTRETIEAKAGDAVITVPIVVLVSNGTARAAEVFAAAIDGSGHGEIVGEQTQGSAGDQRLVKLPQDRGLWLTWARYLTKDGEPIHEKGLTPDLVVEEPNVEFDEIPPAGDTMLDKAIERAMGKKAA
ncbi:MAG: S41 family peptidase [Acidobacteriota bacterium]|nr:S41 family peptidase [Acidobacteriota bacterium]